MQAARRIYIYAILFVSLGMTAYGIVSLLELILNGIWQALGGRDLLSLGADEVRRRLSLSIPFIVIAGPIWLLHWRLANGGLRRASPEQEADRQSPVRALYLALVLGGSLVAAALSVSELTRRAVEAAAGVEFPTVSDSDILRYAAMLLVATAVWSGHVLFRQCDLDAGRLGQDAVWPPRLYLYLAAGVGALMLLAGVAGLLEIAVDAALGTGDDVRGFDPFSRDAWWEMPLVDATGTALTGALVWALHWRYSLRLLDRHDWAGRSERESRTRLVYLSLLLLAGALVTVLGVASALETPLRLLLDVFGERSDAEVAREIIVPLARTLPFAALWWLHRRHLLGESGLNRDLGPKETARVATYGAALVAIAVAGFGLAAALGLGTDLLLDGSRTDDLFGNVWREDLAWFVGLALAGGALWVWQWRVVARRMAADAGSEQRSLVRRAYLYLVLAGSVVALLVPAAIVIYRLLERLLGVGQAGDQFVSDLSTPLGALVTAGASLAYHGLLLRRDLQVADEAATPAPEQVGRERARAILVLSGPPGSDLDAVVDELRLHLPEEFDIRPAEASMAAPPRLD